MSRGAGLSATVTGEFRYEFEAERATWLRTRFVWYAGVLIALVGLSASVNLGLLGYGIVEPMLPETWVEDVDGAAPAGERSTPEPDAGAVAAEDDGEDEQAAGPGPDDAAPGADGEEDDEGPVRVRARVGGSVPALGFVSDSLRLIVVIVALRWVLRRPTIGRDGVLRAVWAVILITGGVDMLVAPLAGYAGILASGQPPEAARQVLGAMAGPMVLLPVMIAHLFASLFLPWTARESLRPVVPLMVLSVVIAAVFGVLAADRTAWMILVTALVAPLAAVPGLAVVWFRNSRFRKRFGERMLRTRYGELKRELVDARRIHEDLFPEVIEDGPVTLRYVYEPMRQIGGDLLFAHPAPDGSLTVLLIDVTGHGVSAALAVNRLHGELSRELGEQPDAAPGDLLAGLNAYLHHTLAVHSVYATAIAARVDPSRDELVYASAGHPPAFLRTADGRLDRLDSTTLLLGACRRQDFVTNERTLRMMAGDRLLLVTDGATEAVNPDGRMLRIDGMQRVAASVGPTADRHWASAAADAVDDWRAGPPRDDTLIVEVARPV